MTMTCSDLDAPTTLSYQLSENGGGTFSIDSRGDITLIKSAHQTISHLVIYNLRFCQKDESNHNLLKYIFPYRALLVRRYCVIL